MEGRRNVQGLALRAAAACALLAVPGGCATLRGEAAIGAGYRLLVAAHDRDGDGALDAVPKALYVGTGGNLTMRGVNGTSDQLWKNVPSGAILPFRARYVRATGTSAADILALY